MTSDRNVGVSVDTVRASEGAASKLNCRHRADRQCGAAAFPWGTDPESTYAPDIWALITQSKMHNWPLISQAPGATYDYSLCYSSKCQPVIGKWTQQSCLPVCQRVCSCVCLWTPEADRLTEPPKLLSSTHVFLMFCRSIHHINTPSFKCSYHLLVCSCHGSECCASRELGHANASLVSVILISCVFAPLHPLVHSLQGDDI